MFVCIYDKLHVLGLNASTMSFSVLAFLRVLITPHCFSFILTKVVCLFFSMLMICLSQVMMKKESSLSIPYAARSLIWRILVVSQKLSTLLRVIFFLRWSILETFEEHDLPTPKLFVLHLRPIKSSWFLMALLSFTPPAINKLLKVLSTVYLTFSQLYSLFSPSG